MRQLVRSAQADGKSVGVVMTMGALHAGHLSLVEACQWRCDVCVVTIFVNPTQFLPSEDLDRYPRRMESDLEALAAMGVEYVFTPSDHEMYRSDHTTFIHPPRVAEAWEGAFRPGHFQGVCTIVLKLLQCIPGDWAFFGEKDYQQYLVIRKMAEELNLETEIVSCPIVRDGDGMALSSRNEFLTKKDRQRALAIPQSLKTAVELYQLGERRTDVLVDAMRDILGESGIDQPEYVVVVDADDLRVKPVIESPSIALVAARIGSTRLIDNGRLDPS